MNLWKQSMRRCWGLQAGHELGFRDKAEAKVARHMKKRDPKIKKAHAESGYVQLNTCAQLGWMQLNISPNYYLIPGQKLCCSNFNTFRIVNWHMFLLVFLLAT